MPLGTDKDFRLHSQAMKPYDVLKNWEELISNMVQGVAHGDIGFRALGSL